MKKFETDAVLKAARVRASLRHTGNGAAETIRRTLRVRPMRFSQLCARIPGFTKDQVRVSLSQLLGRTGGVQSDGKRPATYSLCETQSGPTALQPMKPLKRDPFELWRLCSRDPFETSKSAILTVIR